MINGSEDMEKSKVYFTDFRARLGEGLPTKLKRLMKKAGFASMDKMCIRDSPYVDIFLIDYKVTDPEVYKKYVGGDNSKVEENIRRLYASGAKLRIRCPIIPGVNDTEDHFNKIAELTKELPDVEGAEILPYHKLGVSKAARIGIESEEFEMPSNETVAEWKNYIWSQGGRLVNAD